jgi:hypothetical protein
MPVYLGTALLLVALLLVLGRAFVVGLEREENWLDYTGYVCLLAALLLLGTALG